MPAAAPVLWPYVAPVLLLLASNVFMTLAWYGHLRFKGAPILVVIVVSWGIAFVEHCLGVPANRIGHNVYAAAELKTIQEIITPVIFARFYVLYLGEALNWRQTVGFVPIAAGAGLVFPGRG